MKGTELKIKGRGSGSRRGGRRSSGGSGGSSSRKSSGNNSSGRSRSSGSDDSVTTSSFRRVGSGSKRNYCETFVQNISGNKTERVECTSDDYSDLFEIILLGVILLFSFVWKIAKRDY